MTGLASSAETRLSRLLERLLTAAGTSLAAGDLEPARATAEEVRAVDPENRRADLLLRQVVTRQLRALIISSMHGYTSPDVESGTRREALAGRPRCPRVWAPGPPIIGPPWA